MKNTSSRFFGLGKMIPFIRPYIVGMLVMILLGTLSSVADSIYPLFNRYAINHYIALGTLDTLTTFILLYLLVLFLQVICNVVSSYLIGKIELYIGRDMKNAVFHHLQTLSFSYYNTHNVGYIHARLMSDTDKIATAFTWRIMDLVWYGSYILFVFVVMFLIDVKLALALFILVPAALILISLFQRKLIVWNRRVREQNALITGNFNEGITGARTIRALAVEEIMGRDFDRDTGTMHRMAVRTTKWSGLFTSTVTALSSIALALVLWKGGNLSVHGMMKIGTLSVFMSYALGIMEPIQHIVEAVSSFIALQASIERTSELLETAPNVMDTAKVEEVYGDTFHPKRENWEPLHGDVEFRDVSFHYPDGEELVLSHFDLMVPQGSNIAIVGETGAGKSTLVNLVCRFFEPTEGQVLIDGRDVRDRSQLWLHSNIGYVLQSPHLFSGSVRENLRYGKPEATDEEIWNALKLVSADEVVRNMEEGLDSEVGEGGALLSTGEKQLLSFARAILADPAILILDEATSSVDTVTEKKIQQAIHTITESRTSFVIAHRLSTIVDCDRILAISDGRIVESGTHEELMMKKGYYYRLYTRQYEDLETSRRFQEDSGTC